MINIHTIARLCQIEGCDKSRGPRRRLCQKHHMREWRWDDPNRVTPPGRAASDPAERFWSKVDMAGPDDCWIYHGTVLPKGYGQFRLSDKVKLQAHRFAYTDKVGPIPADMTIDHLCVVKLCMNPAHMEIVTGAENTRRRWERLKAATA